MKNNNIQEQNERARWNASQSKSNKRDMGNSVPDSNSYAPQVDEMLEGCERMMEGITTSFCRVFNLCYKCRKKLKPIKQMAEQELERVNEMIEFLIKKMSEVSYAEGYFSFVEEEHQPQIKELSRIKKELLEKIEELQNLKSQIEQTIKKIEESL